MKNFSIMLASVLLLSAIMVPIIEIMGAFIEMIRMNTAIVVSARGAIHSAADPMKLRDVKAEIQFDEFQDAFRENFCTVLKLRPDYSPDASLGSPYHAFEVTITPKYLDADGNELSPMNESGEKIVNSVKIEVKTNYKFKTALMERFSQSIKEPAVLRISRLQQIKIVN